MGKNTKKTLTMPETFDQTLHETLVSEQAQLTSAVQAVNEKIEKNAGVQRNEVSTKMAAQMEMAKEFTFVKDGKKTTLTAAAIETMFSNWLQLNDTIKDQTKQIDTLNELVAELQNRKCFQPIGEAVKNWAINLVGKIFRKKANQASPKTVVEIDGINEIPAEGLVITNN